MTRDYLPLAQIIAELDSLCQAGRTGVLRITTDNNHTAQFGLEAGRIVSARYRIKRGQEALDLMKRVQAGQYSFEEGKSVNNEEATLPSSEEIFAQLGHAAASAPASAPAAPSVAAPSAAPTSAAGEFSTAAKIAFEDALAEHIGPMASIVCRKVLAQASDIGEAIEMMKAKIPDPERAEQFERNVMSRTLV